ncbi:protein DEK-like isoform X1 [Cyprinus carpio]|uniref:Protein DEK n=1 Tax=Cyprinus carpio TaxID=7962 RepID=A0A9R0AH20_CYPCA|nr:protein DEK-like isoform X1 [Cyprinus carpio]XP_042597788.1 protein DEK-like isoform X1 [Cyprinus carpio]XP_042597789.1 protein DEK-like isoform X1 [Cyprinus carpio]XP_042597790.1 protein DEK-like isoform X1 [Cyprinus carpio]XP_042597791.1 protein DEK-like isoform X1 [Cyprinus carpio]XP_042597792.1 protein DEK-like isoform X1 [Cyprinus carpio]
MSEEMEAVKTEDLALDENSIKKGEDDKQKKKRKSPSDDTEQDESEEPKPKSRSKPKLFEPEILEGKREKKIIQRLDLMSKPKEKPKIESTGRGAKLGDIVRINHSIGKLKAPLLKPLHKIVYDRPGTASTLRKNLRLFNGFPFGEESDLYNKKMEKVKRLHKEQLRTICQTLDLERSGTQIVLSERIMKFLAHPTNSGKPILKKKKKSTKDAKRERSSSKSKKQQKKVESGKSKPIVTDSSSDDDDDDDDNDEEGKENSKDTEKSVTASQKNKDSGDKSSDEEEDDEDDDDAPEEDSNKEEKTPQKKKSSTTKSTKKSEKSEQTASDESDQDVHEDKNAKKTKKPAAKRKAPAKPFPKTKKADSSSNRGKKNASKNKGNNAANALRYESESSDDDEPLIKMIKKPPTEEQLKQAIKDLLKDANLEEVTMKQITRQVYDKYPDFDLTSRKEFIKETVKGLVS